MTRHGLARVLSKLGVCSRSEATRWILDGRVALNGRVSLDPETPARIGIDRVSVDGREIGAEAPIHLMLNKPRGLVTSSADERGRETVYACFDGAGLPWVAPVGRLDKASEGLLLFSNDPVWAAGITDPERGPPKTYHVQVEGLPEATALAALEQGIVDQGEPLRARSVRLLRQGRRNAWIEIVLDEGRNRQIRRMLAHIDLPVLRLVRVAIGGLVLGDLPKGGWRYLQAEDLRQLATSS